mgnify:CR=1 FL=1
MGPRDLLTISFKTGAMITRNLFLTLILCIGASVGRADTLKIFGRDFNKSVAVWGSAYAPPGVTESARENAKFELYIRPEIELYRFNKKAVLVGYSLVTLIQNSQGFTYDNKVTFAAGLELKYQLSKAVRLGVGAKWKIEHEFTTGIRRDRLIFTADASVWKTWKPKWMVKSLPQGSELILSGWSNYRFPASLHEFERDNGQWQGALKLAVAMPIKQTQIKFAPFLSIKAKADHKGRSYNNTLEPAFGLDVKFPIKDGGSIAVGVKTAYQRRHATGTSEHGNTAYVTWYKKF